MARRGIDRLRMAGGRAIAAAIIGRAQVRAAFDDLAGNFDLRLAGVEACGLGPAARIVRNAARLRRVGFVLLRPPIGGPFPDVADHVVDAVAVGRECHHRRGALEAVLARFSCGKLPCQVLARCSPPGLNSSPQANSAPSSPPRAANSHSASVGSSLPAHWA